MKKTSNVSGSRTATVTRQSAAPTPAAWFAPHPDNFYLASQQSLWMTPKITLDDTQQTLDDAPFAPTPHPAGQQVLFFSNPLIAYRSAPGKTT
jgi:hypothetical protein